jgi:AraC-like DNA-binding protein
LTLGGFAISGQVFQGCIRMSGIDLFLSVAGPIGAPFYREFPPADDLRPFVACTWMRLVRQAGGEASDAILPDGCADIMAYDNEPPIVAGPDAVTRWVKLRDGLVITGIRLRPGACRAVLGCPAQHLVNGSVLLSDIATDATALHRRLLQSDNVFSRLALLENWVRSALERVTINDRTVIAACRLLGANPKIEIGDVARRFDWNARMIHRQFIAACGYGPKHFQRIMRIQGALRVAHSEPAVRLGDVAAATGYADQAHMTRDFRDITGFTPVEYFTGTAARGWGAWISEDW